MITPGFFIGARLQYYVINEYKVYLIVIVIENSINYSVDESTIIYSALVVFFHFVLPLTLHLLSQY